MDYFFLGDPELVTAFRFVGVDGLSVRTAEEALACFRRLTESRNETSGAVLPVEQTCRVIIMTEQVAQWLGGALVEWQLSCKYPLVVELPGLMGKLPGRKSLVDSIREAIGVRV